VINYATVRFSGTTFSMELLLLPYFACDLSDTVTPGFPVKSGTTDFFLLQNICTRSGALPASRSMGKGGGVELPAREVDHSSSFGFVIKNEWKYNSASAIYAFMPCTGTTLPLSSAFA
jgi:hypothetical protein